MQPLSLLVEEHKLIIGVLDSFDSFLRQADQIKSCDTEDLKNYLYFIKHYADQHHHGKEEKILFKEMCENGFSNQVGPVAVMLYEHDEGREYIATIQNIIIKNQVIEDKDLNEVIQSGQDYISLLRQHIMKEDTILYPMAVQRLSRESLLQMEGDFVRFESDTKNLNEKLKCESIAERLIQKYPRFHEQFQNECMGCGERC